MTPVDVGAAVLLTGTGLTVFAKIGLPLIVGAVRGDGHSNGNSNGVGEWRGKIETLLENSQRLQERSMDDMAEMRRTVDRSADVLARVDGALTDLATRTRLCPYPMGRG